MSKRADRPSYHIRNLGYAAAMQNARKDILTILCDDPGTLHVLMNAYANVRRGRKPLNEMVHIYPRRIADNLATAEDVIRERANDIVLLASQILDISPPPNPVGRPRARRTPVAKFPSDAFIARQQLVDEMLDIRLSDAALISAPKTAVDEHRFSQKSAESIQRQLAPAIARLAKTKAIATEANIHLIDKFLYAFRDRADYQDIAQEGAMGLMEAVNRWDSAARYRFSTHACLYVKGYALNYIANNGSMIRIPVHVHATLDTLQKFEARHLALNGELPSADTVAKNLDLPVAKIRGLRQIRRDDQIFEHPELYTDDYIMFVKSSGKTRYAILSKPSRATTRPDRIADTQPNPEAATSSTELKEFTARVLQTLTPREEGIIKMRFGMEDGNEYTLEEVGASFQLTKNRIRQIELKSLLKLRHSRRARIVAPCVDFKTRMGSKFFEDLVRQGQKLQQSITPG